MNGLTHGRFLYSTCPAAKLEDDLLGLSILGGGGAVAMMMMMIRSHGVCFSTVDLENSWLESTDCGHVHSRASVCNRSGRFVGAVDGR